MVPVGGLMQPSTAGGLPENPETKRRFKNLVDVTGLMRELATPEADPATEEDLLRIHPQSYIDLFRETSAKGGGELGLRTPFGPDGFEIAALSAGLTKAALIDAAGAASTMLYALSRLAGAPLPARFSQRVLPPEQHRRST